VISSLPQFPTTPITITPDLAKQLNPDFLKPGGLSILNAYTRPFYARLGVRFEF
jgi:hypothetical protein